MIKHILTDRTAEETDELCGMKYWWYKLEARTGIVPTDEPPFFLEGRLLHTDLAAFAAGMSTEAVLDSIPSPTETGQVQLETHSRRLGWVAAFGLYVEPFLRAFGEEVLCEAEVVLNRSPLWIAVTPDRIQRRKGGGLVYREWKTTSSLRKEWQDHWLYSIQIHLGLQAVAEALGEPIEYGQVLGLNKGYTRDQYLIHPYVWAYRKGSEWQHEYKSGWEHAPVWDYPGGMLEWVERLGVEVGQTQFCWTAPIFLDQRLLDRWIQQRLRRHEAIQPILQVAAQDLGVRDAYFDQRLIHCRPTHGSPCSYLAACHNTSVNQNPLGSGLYGVRVPHHDLERRGKEY